MISNTPYLFKIIYFLGFPYGSAGKESAFNAGDLDLISGLGRSLGEGKGYPLQYSVLENSMDSIVHGFTELDTTGLKGSIPDLGGSHRPCGN